MTKRANLTKSQSNAVTDHLDSVFDEPSVDDLDAVFDGYQNSAQSAVKRSKGGKFAKGTKGGPGRRKGTLNFKTEVRRYAKRHNLPEAVVFDAAISGLIRGSLAGDSKACKEVLDRYCGPLATGAGTNVNVDVKAAAAAAAQSGGPPMPEVRARAAQLADVHKTISAVLNEGPEK